MDLIKPTQAIFDAAGLKLDDELLNFLDTASMNSQLANYDAWASAVSAVFSAKLSAKHAASLQLATWVLAGATIALAIANIILIFSRGI